MQYFPVTGRKMCGWDFRPLSDCGWRPQLCLPGEYQYLSIFFQDHRIHEQTCIRRHIHTYDVVCPLHIICLFPDSGFKAFPAPVSPSGAAVAGFSVFFGFTFLYPDSRITLLMLSQQTLLPVQHVPPVHRHLPPPKQSTLLLSIKI